MFLIGLMALVSVVAAGSIWVFLNRKTEGIIFGIVFFIAYLAVESFTVIKAGHVGVQVTLGETNLEHALPEGWSFVNPISDVKQLEVRLQKATLTGQSAGTKDQQQVHTDIVVNYRLTSSKAPFIYKEYGFNVAEKVLEPAINDAFKAVTGKYTSEELITKRDNVNSDIKTHLQDKVMQYDIVVNGVSLVNFGFNPDYQKAIESKVIATQLKQKADQDLERIKVEAQQEIAKAEGKAKAITIETAAINSQGGGNYVKLKEIEKWDGKYPSTMVNGAAGTMLNVAK